MTGSTARDIIGVGVFVTAATLFIAWVLSTIAGKSTAPTPSTAADPVVCRGKFTEDSLQRATIRCDDGRTFVYSSYKYHMLRRQVN